MNKLMVWFKRKTPAELMQTELARLAESHYEYNKQLHFTEAQIDYVENRTYYLQQALKQTEK